MHAADNGRARLARVALCGGIVGLMLCACGGGAPPADAQSRGADRLERSSDPLEPQSVAARIALARASAILGDEAGVRTQMEAMSEEYRRAIRLPDVSRPIDREMARSAVRGLQGVRAVAWVDRSNLLVRVGGAQWVDQQMIDRVCIRLQPLGDTLAVVVNLQDAAARTHGGMQTLSRNCQLQGDDRALLQDRREMDVLPEHWRRQQSENARMPAGTSSEATDIIRDTTPEM